MKADKIPEATITRLSMYSRYLTKMEEQNVQKVSSVDIAQGVQGTPAQVRKDLAYFGDFGMRGVGYNVTGLNNIIKEILGVDHPWKMILVGAGNLGSALTHYAGFEKRGFKTIVAPAENRSFKDSPCILCGQCVSAVSYTHLTLPTSN